MRAFEYAAPRDAASVLSLLSAEPAQTEVLAGGTDLVGLMKKMIVTPSRVVNIKHVPQFRGIVADSSGVTIGAVTPLDEVLDDPALADYAAVTSALRGITSMQLLAQGTVGGELCQRPRCWYFRSGQGLLAGKQVASGDNRYHAILGNSGPAKFSSPSRLAPALIALGASVRVLGPGEQDELLMPVDALYRVPRHAGQRETVLLPNQVIAQVVLPPIDDRTSAYYEVRHGEAPDAPLVSAAVSLRLTGGVVREATIALGQVAPVPWIATAAVAALVGRPVDPFTAEAAGVAAVADATPLSGNAYKIKLARTAVKRAVLMAAGQETGGF